MKKENNDFVKDLLDDVNEHLENINKFEDDTYLLTESDVNKTLKECDSFIDSQSKALLIHFPNIEPITDFQKVYTIINRFYITKKFIRGNKIK